MSNKSVQIDEEGYLISEGFRVQDEVYGFSILSSIEINDKGGFQSKFEGTEVEVHSFDLPLVATNIEKSESGKWTAFFPYQFQLKFDLSTLLSDEWDRFYALGDGNKPFLFSRGAQATLFNLLDDFDDDAVIASGTRHEVHPLLNYHSEFTGPNKFWTDLYETNETRWDLMGPHPELGSIVSQLKLQTARVLVLGAGRCHDANFLAKLGHKVMAVDISPLAIEQAKKLYGENPNLEFLVSDIFELPKDFDHSFDLVFEHTCYCAIDPKKRKELVKVWNRVLSERGNLLGIFWAMWRPLGPPFGTTEWEIRKRLEKKHRFLYWNRLTESPENRQGSEFVVFTEKLDQ